MIYDKIVRHVVFPAAQILAGGATAGYARSWEETQWLSPDEMRALQLEKLRAMLAHAAEHVPWYRESWKTIGFGPRDVTSLDDLSALPVLDKTALREHTSDFLADNVSEKMSTAKTGGSTGEPLAFPIGNALRAGSVANMVRCRRWWGIEPGDRSGNFWGHSRFIRRRPLDGVRKSLAAAKGRLLNRIVLSAYDLSDQSMEGYWLRLRRFRPAFLIGYATSLYVFAEFLLRRGYDGEALRLKAVISTAEVLYDWQQEVIASAFGAPVVNEYGMCEAGIIAYQCPQGSMHCMDEAYVVEILPVEGSASGDIVVTELENRAAPLIRYNTRDMAERVEDQCECGRGLSRISKVEGRAYDIIYASDGKVVAGALLTHTMKSCPKVARYQILQRDMASLEITYTEASPLADGDRDFIVSTLRRHLGVGVNVTLTRAADIPRERSGKHRWLKSLVTPAAAAAAREAAK